MIAASRSQTTTVWRQVASHHMSAAITLQSTVVGQRLRVLHAQPLGNHLVVAS